MLGRLVETTLPHLSIGAESSSDPHMVMSDNAQVSSMSQKLVCIFLVGH
jgi:hypothetical protein